MKCLLVLDSRILAGDLAVVNAGKDFPVNNSFNHSAFSRVRTDMIALVKESVEKYSVNGGKTERIHSFSLVLPKTLEFDALDLTAIGALQGELRKSPECASDVKFTSSEPLLHNLVLRLYRKFNVKPEEVSWRIVGLRNPNDSEALSWWLSKTKFPENCFKGFRHSKGQVLSKTPEFGTVETWVRKGRSSEFNNTLFFHVLRKLITATLKEALEDKRIAVPVLKGLFAAEGFVDVRSRFCGLACNDEKELEVYSKLLESLGIRASKGRGLARFSSGGFRNPINFEITRKLDLFECCSRKQNAFRQLL